MTGVLTLHHLEYSQSFRILWLLEEIGTDYELISYNRDPETLLAPREYKALSPLGTAPVITHGDIVLAESSAIIDHLMDTIPDQSLRPGPGSQYRLRYLFWFHAAQGSMMPLQLMDTVLSLSQSRMPFLLKPFVAFYAQVLNRLFIYPRLETLLSIAEADLSEEPWFGGDSISAADFLISYNLIVGEARGMITDKYPNCLEWIQRMKSLPSYARAIHKDGRSSVGLDY